MTGDVRTLLVAPHRAGGEGVYTRLLQRAVPPGFRYTVAGGTHEGAPGAPCSLVAEIAMNRLVQPRAIPDINFRALRLRERFDLVHAHAHPTRLFGDRGVPFVMSENSASAVYLGAYLGWDDDRLDRAYRRTRRIYRTLGIRDRLLALDRVTRVYVFSEWARELNLRWGSDPAKVDVVAPGFPVPPESPRGPRDTFTFLFVASDFERKGGFDVVEAFDRVAAAHPHARLVLEGPAPQERNPDRLLHEWVGEDRRERVAATLARLERQGLARHVGRVTTEALHGELYPAADAFVMPTLAEGYGFTNIDAMSHGLPVVSSRIGPIPEVVEHGRTGLLVDAGDVDALTVALDRLVADPGDAREMGAAGRAAFLERFTLEAFRDRLGAFYRRALEG